MSTSDKKRGIKNGAVDFPQFPGEDCLAHTANTYQEQLDARLTGLGLLAVAHPGASPGECWMHYRPTSRRVAGVGSIAQGFPP